MLYMFAMYYQLMGWRVIIYDRFGFHYEVLKDLLHLPGIDYFPFTGNPQIMCTSLLYFNVEIRTFSAYNCALISCIINVALHEVLSALKL